MSLQRGSKFEQTYLLKKILHQVRFFRSFTKLGPRKPSAQGEKIVAVKTGTQKCDFGL